MQISWVLPTNQMPETYPSSIACDTAIHLITNDNLNQRDRKHRLNFSEPGSATGVTGFGMSCAMITNDTISKCCT